MKALVISGGGSKGAFAGGFAQYLIEEKKEDYDIFVGTSTGSLLISHLSAGKIAEIKKVFTSVRQKDIYNISPFIIKKDQNGLVKTKINHFNTVRMILKRKKTFGEHKNLKKTIRNAISPELFEQIKASPKKVILTISNLTTNRIEYRYAEDCSYDDWIDWMWASTSFVPWMSLVEKNGFEYADGGFGNYIPIEEAVNLGATEIDVIVLTPRHLFKRKNKTKTAFDLLLNSMQFMHDQLASHDILIGHLESIYNDDVKVHFHFTPRQLTEFSFYFEPELMKNWWQEGFDCAKSKYHKK